MEAIARRCLLRCISFTVSAPPFGCSRRSFLADRISQRFDLCPFGVREFLGFDFLDDFACVCGGREEGRAGVYSVHALRATALLAALSVNRRDVLPFRSSTSGGSLRKFGFPSGRALGYGPRVTRPQSSYLDEAVAHLI